MGELYKCYYSDGDIIIKEVIFGEIVYVDSNNFQHNLNGYAWKIFTERYYIHGVTYYNKRDWLNKKEEILLQIHREEMLNDI